MNIEQAKAIPIAFILQKMGLKPSRKTNRETWYFSPLRDEKTASFHVNDNRNVWYDFGLGVGGDIVDLGCSYLAGQKQSNAVSDSLAWLKTLAGDIPLPKPVKMPKEEKHEEDPTLVVKSVKPLEHLALVNYLETRGIPEKVAAKFLKEIRIFNTRTGKNIFALGLQNESEGYEARNSFFKGCIGPKDVCFIRGNTSKPEGINLFEGFMDFLTVVTRQNGLPFKNDSIILNSLSCIKHAIPYIKDYGYQTLHSWMDNDPAGKSATLFFENFCKSENKLSHQPMNHMYSPFKDVNAWHMHKLEL